MRFMKRKNPLIVLIILMALTQAPARAATVQGDVDSNGALDVARGGTNAATPEGARASLGAASADHAHPRQVILFLGPPAAPLATGDSQAGFSVPASMAGLGLAAVEAHIYTASTSGAPAFQIHKKQLADDSITDMLTTPITIDAGERDSSTAAAPAVIDQASRTVAAGDEIHIDVDAAGAGAKGGEIRLLFQ